RAHARPVFAMLSCKYVNGNFLPTRLFRDTADLNALAPRNGLHDMSHSPGHFFELLGLNYDFDGAVDRASFDIADRLRVRGNQFPNFDAVWYGFGRLPAPREYDLCPMSLDLCRRFVGKFCIKLIARR
ncbi:MAG: hypothetical protein ABI145_16345, partial [Steroidobacteraceae bacterium]